MTEDELKRILRHYEWRSFFRNQILFTQVPTEKLRECVSYFTERSESELGMPVGMGPLARLTYQVYHEIKRRVMVLGEE